MIVLRTFVICVVAGTAVMATGCESAMVTTTVDSSGSYTRSLQFTGESMGTAPSRPQTFRLPSGALWKTSIERSKEKVTYTAIRNFAPGDPDAKDLVIRADKGATVANSASLRQIQPGLWEYREVLHWEGPVDTGGIAELAKEVTPLIKEALPADLATDANAAAIAKSMLPSYTSSMLGPPRPLIPDLLGNSDLAGMLLENDMGKPIDDALQQQFGDKMTSTQRLDVIRMLVALCTSQAASTADNKANAGSGAGGASSDNDGSLDSLTFVLNPPGKVISTNGIYNQYTGEVFWGLYPLAACPGDVVMTADFQAGAATAK
jgi:hypothetical protein